MPDKQEYEIALELLRSQFKLDGFATALEKHIKRLDRRIKEQHAALVIARRFIPGMIKTRDMGQCDGCGVSTSSGMDKYCAKCATVIVGRVLRE